MSDRLQWFLSLEDRMSGPGAKIEKQLSKLRVELKTLDIEAKQNKLDKLVDPVQRHRAELVLQRDKLLMSKAAIDKVGGSSRKAAGETHHWVNRLHDLLHIGQIVGGVFERMSRVYLAVGRNISHAVSFKQSSMVGLTTFLGGNAEKIFDRLTAFGARAGGGGEKLVSTARSLAMVGMEASHLEATIKRLADLSAIGGSGDAVAGVMGSVFSVGRAGIGDFEALRGTGIKVEELYEDWAERMGAKRDRIFGKALIENAPYGIGKNYFMQLVQGQIDKINGNVPGSKALEAAQNPESKLKNVFAQLERMFFKLSRSSGVTTFGKVLDNLSNIFNPSTASGNAIFERLNELSDRLAKVLTPLTGREGRKRMEEFFDSLTEKTKTAIEVFTDLAGLIGKVTKGWSMLIHEPAAYGKTLDQLAGGDQGTVTGGPLSGLTFEARERVARQSRPMVSPTVHFTQHIDARGASKDDAEHIADEAARRAEEAVTRVLERANAMKGNGWGQ